ncbi:MAG: DUF4194 domain-containing protein [Sediminibacterium sp.]|jgi:hypothetical protein|nr:DUF4194 domain-containing protein [Asinibacterium sp. OR53]MBR2647890.1 DUF4194 domain-containing protein [Sediminibacterium sp.]MCA6441125.1 DUF4194 domain-containing protein [Chitinophagaceae bacterium]MCA6447531.1 DUF4194 domain-containing protein [Chitinophagaceae bacterium]
METKIPRAPFAAVIIKLLQGPVYADDKNIWRELQAWSSAIQEYFGKIGMTLEIADQDGFARIIQPEAGENDETPLPRLMRKQSLTYEATLLAVILREGLEEFDIKSDGTKFYLTQKEIKERIELFYKEQPNKSKLWKDLSRPITSLLNIGILKLNREDAANKDNNQYEIKRIIKAFISNDKLEEIKNKLSNYVNPVQQ